MNYAFVEHVGVVGGATERSGTGESAKLHLPTVQGDTVVPHQRSDSQRSVLPQQTPQPVNLSS